MSKAAWCDWPDGPGIWAAESASTGAHSAVLAWRRYDGEIVLGVFGRVRSVARREDVAYLDWLGDARFCRIDMPRLRRDGDNG